MKWELVTRNVAALVDPPRVERKEFVPLDAQEAARLLIAARGDRLEALYVLALTTGLRRGELLGLRWQDVDLDARVLYVRKTLQIDEDGHWRSGDPKTKRSRRPVVLVDMAVDALKRHRERQDLEREQAGELWKYPALVFTNTIGGHVWGEDLLKRDFYPLLAKAGLRRVRFHDLRHSTATLLLACGIHPKVVSEILGHSAIHITLDLYTHVNEGMQRHALEALEALIGGQLGRQEAESADGEDGDEQR